MTALLTLPTSQSPVATAAVPFVLEPPRHGDFSAHLLTPGARLVGSHPDCEICLKAEGVAAEHAVLNVEPHRVTVRALDPRTWLNDGPIRGAALRVGDRVAFGPVVFRVRRATPDDLLDGWPAPKLPPLQTAVLAPPNRESVADGPARSVEPADSAPQRLEPHFDPTMIATAVGPEATADFVAGWTTSEHVDDTACQITTYAIADLVVSPTSSQQPAPLLAETLAELQREQSTLTMLRQQLGESRAAFREETLQREAQFAATASRLSRQATELLAAQTNFDERDRELRGRDRLLDDREAQLRESAAALVAREAELAAERMRIAELGETTRRQVQSEVARLASDWSEFEEHQQRLLSHVAEQSTSLGRQQSALNDAQRRLEAAEQELQSARLDLDAQRRGLHVEREQLDCDRASLDADRAAWAVEKQRDFVDHEARETALQQLEHEVRIRFEHVQRQQDQLARDVHVRAQSQAELHAIEQQLQRDRRLLSEQQADWHAERDAAWFEVAERRRRLDAEADQLQATRQEIERLERALEAEIRTAVADRLRWQTELQSLSALAQDYELTAVPSEALVEPTGDVAGGQDHVVAEVIEPDFATEAAVTGTIEPFAPETDDELRADDTAREDIQAALDALAERFEEFSVLEHRLSVRHDELLELQQDLAVCEAELTAEREALGLQQVTWEGERSLWEEERQAWEETIAEFGARQIAWEIARQAQAAELIADRQKSTVDSRMAAAMPPLNSPTQPATEELPEIVEPLPSFEAATANDPLSWLPVKSDSDDLDQISSTDSASGAIPEPARSASVEDESIDAIAATEELVAQAAVEDEPVAELSLPEALSAALTNLPKDHAQSVAELDVESGEPWFGNIPTFEPDIKRRPPAGPAAAGEILQAFGLPPVTAVEPTAAVLESPIDQAPVAARELRSELARMFDLPDDFAAQETGSEDAESTDSEPAADSSEPDPQDWRSQLSAALKDAATPVLPSEPVVPPLPPPVPATKPEAEVVEDDSVAAYMERLLARSRQRGSEVAPSPPPPSTMRESAPLPAPDPDFASSTYTPVEVLRPKINVEATRAELQSFRALANQSARSALAVHTLKTTKTELAVQIMLLVGSIGGAVTLMAGAWRGQQTALWPGLGCLIAAGWMSHRVWESWQTLRRWRSDAAPAKPRFVEIDDESTPETTAMAPAHASGAATAPESTEAESAIEIVPEPETTTQSTQLGLPTPLVSEPTGSIWDNIWSDPAPTAEADPPSP